MVFPSQDNVTSTKSSSNFRLPRAATIFFWKLFHFKQKCSCGISSQELLLAIGVWTKFATGQFTLKALDQKLHSIVGIFFFCSKTFNSLVYLRHKHIILFFLYFFGLFSRVKETFNWKMSLVILVQRKALKFECDELKKSFHRRRNFFPLRMILSSCNFRLAVSSPSSLSLIYNSFLKHKEEIHVSNTIICFSSSSLHQKFIFLEYNNSIVGIIFYAL